MQPSNTNGSNTTPILPENPLTFPKQADKPRLAAYDHYDKLYYGDHYSAFAIKAEKGFTDKYSQLRYITANFAGIISRIMADMLFGETITVDCEDDQNQKFVDKLIEENHLWAQCYESELGNSRRGDALFKMRIGQAENNPAAPSTVIIEEITPAIYFPVLDVGSGRNKAKEDVLIWQFQQNGVTYLHKETHRPGYIFHEILRYDPNTERITAFEKPEAFGYQATEETKVDDSLIFHIPNFRDSGYFGASDYRDLEQLFFALNNRITKIDNILDKHSDPILAVPPGVIDEKGKIRKQALSLFEVDNENPGFNKPEYIVWNANLEFAFKEIDKLTDMLYMFSGIAPASTIGDENGGQAESGRALKFKLLSTIRKRNQKMIYYDIALKEMLETAMELARAWGVQVDGESPGKKEEKPKLKWGDGVLNDVQEQIDMEVARVEAGLTMRADAIARLDGISPDEAAAKVKEIDAENAILVPNLDKTVSVKNPTDKNPLASGVPDIPPGETKAAAAPAGKPPASK
jgi:hypothetical protein